MEEATLRPDAGVDAVGPPVVSVTPPSKESIDALGQRFVDAGLFALTPGRDLSVRGIASAVFEGIKAVSRERREVRATAVRGAPVVLVLLVALFVTSEVWRFFGPMGFGRFIIVVLVFGVLGAVVLFWALADELGNVYRTATRATHEELSAAVKKIDEAKPFIGLLSVMPVTDEGYRPRQFRLRRWHQFNIGVVVSIPVFVIATSVGLLSFVILLAVGFFGVDEALTAEWITPSQSRETRDPHAFSVGGLAISTELLKVSAFLASVAALAFTTTVVRDPELRKELIQERCDELKSLVAAWVFYKQALAMVEAADNSPSGSTP